MTLLLKYVDTYIPLVFETLLSLHAFVRKFMTIYIQ